MSRSKQLILDDTSAHCFLLEIGSRHWLLHPKALIPARVNNLFSHLAFPLFVHWCCLSRWNGLIAGNNNCAWPKINKPLITWSMRPTLKFTQIEKFLSRDWSNWSHLSLLSPVLNKFCSRFLKNVLFVLKIVWKFQWSNGITRGFV